MICAHPHKPESKTCFPCYNARRATPMCSVEGCDRLSRRRGMCGMHWQRVERVGDVLTDKTTTELRREGGRKVQGNRTPHERFFDVTIVQDGCWLYNGFRNRAGYGVFYDGLDKVLAHRWIYQEWRGPIAADLTVDHLCFVRNCVNPAHLDAVSQAENSRRMWAAKRELQRITRAAYGVYDGTPESLREVVK